MKFVKISQKELEEIHRLYESVMSQACSGLFLREGAVYGQEIAEVSVKNREIYFETAKKLLIARGWVEDIEFEKTKVVAKGSIEVMKSNSPTCHRLRGIIRQVYEVYNGYRLHCVEEECESTGKDKCVFKLEEVRI